MLALRFEWPGSVIDAQDPEYIDALMVLLRAENDHAALERKRAEAKQRHG